MSVYSDYSSAWVVVRRYFMAYGGWRAILKSPFFGVAFVISALNYDHWLVDRWSEMSLAVIPSLLGFSLGTYAILFSLLTGKLRQALQEVKTDSGIFYIEVINSTFFHFIFVQVLSILWTLLFQSSLLRDVCTMIYRYFPDDRPNALEILKVVGVMGSFGGYLLTVYSVALIAASAIAIYRIGSIKIPG